MLKFVKILSSFGTIGYAPASGTLASIAALIIAWPAFQSLPYLFLVSAIIGLLMCKPSQEAFGHADSEHFVLDEVSGMWLSLLWLPRELWIYIAAFALFRVLDVFKPWPIILLQRMKNPLSIMWDDIAAGAAVNIILQVLIRI